MLQITVESALGEQLGQLSGQTVVCDSSGRALGFFTPLAARPQVDDLQLDSSLSPAEIEALRKDRQGKPLAEILARLGVS